jgi:cytochrome c oxidase subunit 3
VYGSTFFMLTGFHGFHVTIGAIMLSVMLARAFRGHFDAEHHFAFEAAAWYWHFVDVVWLLLFVLVYWL